MKKKLKRGFLALTLMLGMTFATPANALASDGFVIVKDRKTGNQYCYELNYGGWVYYVDHYTLFSNDEGRSWYILNY